MKFSERSWRNKPRALPRRLVAALLFAAAAALAAAFEARLVGVVIRR